MNRPSVTLVNPIKRGDDEITSIELRRPNAGELRGLSIADLVRMDVTAVITVLPRISMPSITLAEVEELDPFDLGELSGSVHEFFAERPTTPTGEKTSSQETSSTPQQTSQSRSDGDLATSGSSRSTSSSSGGDKQEKS